MTKLEELEAAVLAAEADYNAAWDAYWAELKRIKEEYSND
jgi:hypothetical protein